MGRNDKLSRPVGFPITCDHGDHRAPEPCEFCSGWRGITRDHPIVDLTERTVGELQDISSAMTAAGER